MYDVELIVSTNELGICKYATILNTPRKIIAEWIPTKINGYYSISVDSNGTDFRVMDKLVDPGINFVINNMSTIDVVSYWNFTNPGDFIVKKTTELDVDLDFRIGEWIAKLNAKPTANKVSTTWLIGVTGYITIDTDDKPLTTIDLLIKGEELGLHIIGESFRSEDFDIAWTLWPPVEWDLSVTGNIEFISLVIDIFLNGDWLHLWPLIT